LTANHIFPQKNNIDISNVRLTSEPEIGAKLARQSLEASFVTTGESGSSGC